METQLHARTVYLVANTRKGFDNAALSRSQRENPGKLDFKSHTLIGTKLGAVDWCTGRMWTRQLKAVTAIRAAGIPQADPDHDKNLATVLSIFKDKALDAEDPERMKSIIVAWPLAKEVVQFVQDHTEFLIQLCLNNEIGRCIQRTISRDSTNPNVELLDKDFRRSQIIPLHPTLLEETFGPGHIIAEDNMSSLAQIEDSSTIALNEAKAREVEARKAQKAAQKALQKEKKARLKANRRAKMEEEELAKDAELVKKQQVAKEAELAKQAELAQKQQMAKEAKKADLASKAELAKMQLMAKDAEMAKQAYLMKRQRMAKKAEVDTQNELIKKQQIAKDAELTKEAELGQMAELAMEQQVSKEAEMTKKIELAQKQQSGKGAELAKNVEIAKNQEMAKQAEIAMKHQMATNAELARKEKLAKKKELAKAAELAKIQQMPKEAEMVKRAELDKNKQLANAADLAKKKQMAKDAEMAKKAELAKKMQLAKEVDVDNKQQMATEVEMVKKAELVKKEQLAKKASDSPENILAAPWRCSVPDSAIPPLPHIKNATTPSKRADTAVNSVLFFPKTKVIRTPKITFTSQFPALDSSSTTPSKRVGNAAKTMLSFSNTEITGAPLKVASTTQFPKLDTRITTPSLRAGSATKAALSFSKMEVTGAPPNVPSTSHFPKLESSLNVCNSDSASGSSVPVGQKTAEFPRRSDVREQKTKDIKGHLDNPGTSHLSVNIVGGGETSVKPPSALDSETLPLDVSKTRVAAGNMERRNSINFIRSRTDSRASMLQSPLAPPSQVPSIPVTGLDLSSPSINEKSTKQASNEPRPKTAFGTVDGAVKGPHSATPSTSASGRAQIPASASASASGHAHLTPVFMSDEQAAVNERNKSEAQCQQVASKPHFVVNQLHFGDIAFADPVQSSSNATSPNEKSIPAIAHQSLAAGGPAKSGMSVVASTAVNLDLGVWSITTQLVSIEKVDGSVGDATSNEPHDITNNIAESAVFYFTPVAPNDCVSDDRTSFLESLSETILDRTERKYSGGEIVNLSFPKAHDVGGGTGTIGFVLSERRSDVRKRSDSISMPIEESYPEHTSGSRKRSGSVGESCEVSDPALAASALRRSGLSF